MGVGSRRARGWRRNRQRKARERVWSSVAWKRPSGNWLLGLKGRTLDVRVGVGEAGSAGDLISRLLGNVEAEGVSGIAPTHGRPYVLGAASVVGGTA